MSMEDALDGIKSYYTANLEAALVLIDAARTVITPRWKELDTGFVLSKQYPNISIVPSITNFEYGELDVFLTPEQQHSVSILITHAGAGQRDTQFVLLRYAEAISGLVTGSKTKYQCGGLFEVVRLESIDYSIIEANEDKTITQITDIELTVQELLT